MDDISEFVNRSCSDILGDVRLSKSRYNLPPSDLRSPTQNINKLFTVAHHNINSLISPGKLDSLRELTVEYGIDCLGVSETALKRSNVNLYSIKNFKHFLRLVKEAAVGGFPYLCVMNWPQRRLLFPMT
jgi:hypothetical protein